MSQALPDAEVQNALPGWRVLYGRVFSTFRTGSFARGTEFVNGITELAEAANHHPDIVLRYPSVGVSLVSHDVGALTSRDVDLAAKITALAADLGIESDLAAPQVVEFAIDAMDIPAVLPFWQAILGYRTVDGLTDLVDPRGIGPTVWFQQMDAPRPERNRIHIDIAVPHDLAEERVAAAIEAGGRLVTDEHAPAWWVLADVEGNEACITTWQGR
ncbi:MAG TPA: VOC family protein [Jiangellaceae bacterium]